MSGAHRKPHSLHWVPDSLHRVPAIFATAAAAGAITAVPLAGPAGAATSHSHSHHVRHVWHETRDRDRYRSHSGRYITAGHRYSQPSAGRVLAAARTSGSGYQQCVIARESGGNASAVNPSSGAGGLYQFLPSTWSSLGYSGLPQNAPVAVQTQAFQRLYAQAGRAPWSSNGC